MMSYEEWMQMLENMYPEEKPTCLNYQAARALILRFARENFSFRRMLNAQLPFPDKSVTLTDPTNPTNELEVSI